MYPYGNGQIFMIPKVSDGVMVVKVNGVNPEVEESWFIHRLHVWFLIFFWIISIMKFEGKKGDFVKLFTLTLMWWFVHRN